MAVAKRPHASPLQRLTIQRLRLVGQLRPRLPIETRVSGWRSPSVSRLTFSASRYSGSASSYLPCSFSSPPRLPIETRVSGLRSPSVSASPSAPGGRRTCVFSSPPVHRVEGIRVAVAERLTKRLTQQRLRLVVLALILQQSAEVVDRDEGILVAVAERLTLSPSAPHATAAPPRRTCPDPCSSMPRLLIETRVSSSRSPSVSAARRGC